VRVRSGEPVGCQKLPSLRCEFEEEDVLPAVLFHLIDEGSKLSVGEVILSDRRANGILDLRDCASDAKRARRKVLVCLRGTKEVFDVPLGASVQETTKEKVGQRVRHESSD
jgi:hypothetical protein